MNSEVPANFASEAEEAAWWYDNREARSVAFEKALSEGRVRSSSVAARMAAQNLEILVPLKIEDVQLAATLAAKKGQDSNEYLSEILHAALQYELSKVA